MNKNKKQMFYFLHGLELVPSLPHLTFEIIFIQLGAKSAILSMNIMLQENRLKHFCPTIWKSLISKVLNAFLQEQLIKTGVKFPFLRLTVVVWWVKVNCCGSSQFEGIFLRTFLENSIVDQLKTALSNLDFWRYEPSSLGRHQNCFMTMNYNF